MIEDMNARKLCAGTQRGHILACKRFAAFLKRSPDMATRDDIRSFQLHLAGTGMWRECASHAHRPSSLREKNPGGLALHCLDLKWKQRVKVTYAHEMIDIETVSGPNRDFRRRERKGEIPGGGQPAFIAMV
jgi:Phage integrase, N-terminal SAM-like domain